MKAVGSRHLDPRSGAGDVTVGEDEAVRRHHDARAGSAAGAAVRLSDLHGETNNRRADALDNVDDGARVGVKQRLILGSGRDMIGCGRLEPAQAGIRGYDLHGNSPCLPGTEPVARVVRTDPLYGEPAPGRQRASTDPARRC